MAPSPVYSHVCTNSSASTEKLPNWVVHSDSPTAEIPSIHIQHSLSPPPVPGPNIKYEHNPPPLRDVTNSFYALPGPPYQSYNPYVTPAPSDASHTWAVKIGNDNSRAQSRTPTPQNPQARVLGSPFEEPQEVVDLRAWQLSQTGFVHPHLPTCYARHGSVCTGSVIQTVDVSIPTGPGKRFPPGRYNTVTSALAGPLSSSEKTGGYFSTGQVIVKDGERWKGCSVCFQDEVCAEYVVRKSLPVRARRRHICTNGRSSANLVPALKELIAYVEDVPLDPRDSSWWDIHGPPIRARLAQGNCTVEFHNWYAFCDNWDDFTVAQKDSIDHLARSISELLPTLHTFVTQGYLPCTVFSSFPAKWLPVLPQHIKNLDSFRGELSFLARKVKVVQAEFEFLKVKAEAWSMEASAPYGRQHVWVCEVCERVFGMVGKAARLLEWYTVEVRNWEAMERIVGEVERWEVGRESRKGSGGGSTVKVEEAEEALGVV